MYPIEVHTNSSATINDIKKLCIEGINDTKYTLLKGKKKLNDIESAQSQGIKNGDILTLVENQFITHHIAQIEHDFHQHQQELAKQIKDDSEDIFQMANLNEPCLPSGIEQLIESGKEIDFDFNNEQYYSLNAREKIEAAFQEMCKVGNEYIESKTVPNLESVNSVDNNENGIDLELFRDNMEAVVCLMRVQYSILVENV
ncbi:MAG: hypothetical protein EZS28_031206 [Streblomastix strix]|uniref:Ubiquitin-like domain-containing protein n=1 Tax=Streblomastix strix TaxID=222440 RepID=A0A5J4US89_9EUKA|nr:MAG: hypothetical protein EZS28_031206 [Streblomastix strix]